MPLYLEIHRLTIQKDRLVEIDPGNFEVERFKRALVDATFYRDGEPCQSPDTA